MSGRSLKALFATAALVVPMSLMLSAPAEAKRPNIVFRLLNKTSVTLTAFYASPTGVDDWEEDILGEDVISPGDATRININDRRETCLYDFKAVFSDGDKVEKYKVDICDLDGETYQFFDK